METRLAAANSSATTPVVASEPENGVRVDPAADAVPLVPVAMTNGTETESINVWPDEVAEAAFIAEARERGEPVAVPSRTLGETAEETDSAKLPPLDELVNRIPAEVRETLDDLFRAKFTTVRRLPKKLLNPS